MPQIARGSEVFHPDASVTVRRQSVLTGKWHETTFHQTLKRQFDEWRAGMLIQDAFPMLSADQREFLLTGATPDEFNEEFGSDEDT